MKKKHIWEKLYNKIGLIEKKEALSIGFIFGYILFFLTVAYLHLHENFETIPPWIIFVFSLDVILCLLTLYYLFKRFQIRNFVKWCKVNKEILILVIFSIFIRIPTLHEFQRWDGSLYYTLLVKACDSFDFTYQSLIDGFRIIHPAHAYTTFLGIGIYLFADPLFGVLFMQMILSLVAIVCYYGVLNYFFRGATKREKILGTVLFSVCPLFFGIETVVSLEYGVLCFFVIFLYVTLKRMHILELFCGILLILSKQQGVLYYAALIGLLFLIEEIRCKYYENKYSKNAVKLFLWRTIPGYLGILYYFFSSYSPFAWLVSMKEVASKPSAVTLQGIGINIGYICEKLRQIFILNFSWLFVAVIVCGILYGLYKIRFNRVYIVQGLLTEFTAIYIVCLVYILFNLGVVTYANPRYLTLNAFMFSFAFFHVCYKCFTRQSFKKYLLYFMCFVQFIACFLSVDPVSFSVFQSFTTGTNKMYRPFYDNPDMYPADLYSDNTVYNRQYTYLTRLTENMLDKLNYDGSVPFMMVDMSIGQHEVGQYDYINLMLEGLRGRNQLYWNPDEKKITTTEERIKISAQYFSQGQLQDKPLEELPANAYLIILPRQDQNILETIKQRYRIINEYDIRTFGGRLMVYDIGLNV